MTLKQQSGFTLIELLVTTIVLSIGLLGLAQLEIFSMRHSHDAYFRTQATFLAQDIADRMRANLRGINEYDKIFREQQHELIGECRNTSGCTPGDMAKNDAWEWRISLGWRNTPDDPLSGLPNGQGIVCRDPTPHDGSRVDAHGCLNGADDDDPYVIKIWWDDDRDNETPLQRFVTSFRP
jgi:type IV pilus assembly protein PilV